MSGAASIADDSHSFVFPVKGVIPFGSVEDSAPVFTHARESGWSGDGEASNGGEEKGTSFCKLFASYRVDKMNMPFVIHPLSTSALSVESEVTAEMELVHGIFNICANVNCLLAFNGE